MTTRKNYALKTDSYKDVSPADAAALKVLRQEALSRARGGFMADILPFPSDTLYDELEARFGGPYAQWVIDRLDAAKKRESGK